MDLNELIQEKEWRRCRGPEGATVDQQVEAFVYFATTYWYIKHPSRGRILLDLRVAQVETIRAWITNRYTIVLKARQIGFSTLAAAYAFWLCFFWSDRFVIMLSKTEREAGKLLAKAKYGMKFIPPWMKQKGPQQTSDNQLKVTFANESAIESLPSGNDPARGESVHTVIVDEMAFLPNPEEAWAAIEPIADIGGRVIMLSTANGSGDFFHTHWVGALTGTNDFVGIFWPWSAGDRDEAWYAVKKRNMPSWQLHQEYPTTAEEAFIKSGNPVFDVDKLVSLEVSEPSRGFFQYLEKRKGEFVERSEGEFAVWELPQEKRSYVIGVDVAEGLSYGDYSTLHVIEAKTHRVVAHWRGHIDPDTYGYLIAEIGWWYGGCLVAVENNNHGLTTLKAMQRYGYRNLYRQRRLANRNPQQTEILGWRTTTASKPVAIDELAAAIRDDDLKLECRHTIAELKTFVRAHSGKTHGSPHDDRVMSLAICFQMLKYVWLSEYKVEMKAPKYSLDWFSKLMSDDEAVKGRPPLGAFNVRSFR